MYDAFRSTYKFYVIKHGIRNKGMEKRRCILEWVRSLPHHTLTNRFVHRHRHSQTHTLGDDNNNIDLISLRKIYGWAIWFHIGRTKQRTENGIIDTLVMEESAESFRSKTNICCWNCFACRIGIGMGYEHVVHPLLKSNFSTRSVWCRIEIFGLRSGKLWTITEMPRPSQRPYIIQY